MRKLINPSDITNIFHDITEIEIHAAVDTIKEGQETDQLMGQGYILAIQRCRDILISIMKDVEKYG